MDAGKTMSSPFLGNVVEICIVTNDHKRVVDGLIRLGIGPFQIYDFNASSVSSQKYFGQSASSELKVCFATAGSVVWEIMQPVSGPSIMADFLESHGEGIHHVAFDCDHMPVQERKHEFLKRGFQLAQEGVWHGKKGTCHFTFYDTEGATSMCFESYDFSPDWEFPADTVWYPAPPTKVPMSTSTAASAVPTQTASPPLFAALDPGTTGVLTARRGKPLPLKQGQFLKIINTHGKQVIDFFAFGLSSDMRPLPPDSTEYLSMQHTRAMNLRTIPKSGDILYSNRRKPMLKLVGDSSPGVHDTLIPACDAKRYELLGVTDYHESCSENLHVALSEMKFQFPKYVTPAPFNLFMNVPVGKDGSMSFQEPESKGGNYVVFEAIENCVAVMSACPQDITPVNGLIPMDCHYEISYWKED
ncbi:MAG: hypothetical protein Q9187_000086 [Circinaria calcarea]